MALTPGPDPVNLNEYRPCPTCGQPRRFRASGIPWRHRDTLVAQCARASEPDA